jgi:hypothetical protein
MKLLLTRFLIGLLSAFVLLILIYAAASRIFLGTMRSVVHGQVMKYTENNGILPDAATTEGILDALALQFPKEMQGYRPPTKDYKPQDLRDLRWFYNIKYKSPDTVLSPKL